MIVVGAGPAGLAAAVPHPRRACGRSSIEREAIGGQAGSSTLIRNYLGLLARRERRRAGAARLPAGLGVRHEAAAHAVGDRDAARSATATSSSSSTGAARPRARSCSRPASPTGGSGFPSSTTSAARASSTARRCRTRRRWPAQEVYIVGGGNSAGPGRDAPAPLRAPRHPRRARRVARGQHVAVPARHDRGARRRHRGAARDAGRRRRRRGPARAPRAARRRRAGPDRRRRGAVRHDRRRPAQEVAAGGRSSSTSGAT